MIDLNADRVGPGLAAEALLAQIRPHLIELRDKTIYALIEHHWAETLTEGNMRSGIAMLAAIQRLTQTLSHQASLAYKDLEASRRG